MTSFNASPKLFLLASFWAIISCIDAKILGSNATAPVGEGMANLPFATTGLTIGAVCVSSVVWLSVSNAAIIIPRNIRNHLGHYTNQTN